MRRQVIFRVMAAAAFVPLLAVLGWRTRNEFRRVHAAPQSDPNLIWSLGVADRSADEFAPGSLPALTFDVAAGSPATGWRQRQDARDQNPPLYTVVFHLNAVPPAEPLLVASVYFLGASPRAMQVDVNGKRGFFRVQPAAAADLDERQSNIITYSGQTLRVPVERAYLRAGENRIGISFLGDGGSVYYDTLALRRSGGEGASFSASVEPTIFYRRRGEALTEETRIVLRHRAPLGKAEVSLTLAGQTVRREVPEDGYDFGERVADLETPALDAPQPYQLQVSAVGVSSRSGGEFRPEKRWRIFAGLKIHNDIGYTDLQENVQELDNRNTDGVIDIITKNPFYRFNLETSWLVDNFLHSRAETRVRRLMDLAVRGDVGINALYLNLMTSMCTGEELHRALYFSRGLQRRYGVPLKFACVTDAPSHSWFMPTLLADAGVEGFANGSNQTRGPLLQNGNLNEDSPFWWEGPDGKRVLTWFARSYLQLDRLTGARPSLDVLRRTVPQFLARYRRANYPVDAVLLYGLYTDNAAIEDGAVPILQQWNEAYAFPKITPATDSDYYDYLSRHFAEKLPVFRGDAGAYWEDGSGSSAAETAINRDSQRLLPLAETAAAFATLFHPGELYPAGEFRDAWKNLLFYDEHTWGAHNSVAQPGRDVVTKQWEFKRAYAMRAHWAARELLTRSFNRLVQNIGIDGPTLFVFNPDLWTRSGPVQVDLEPNRQLVDLASGKPAAVDVVSEQDGYRVERLLAADVPGLGYKAYGVRRVEAAVPRADRPLPGSWEIESRYYRVRLDPASGAIAELFDKDLRRDLVDSTAPYKLNELLYVSGGEGSRILQDVADLPLARLSIAGQQGAELLENMRTPLGQRIRIRARAPHVPAIETEITVYDALKRVDIVNRIAKEAVRAKEAVYFAFPFRVGPPELAYQNADAWVRPNLDQLPGACRDWFVVQNVVTARDGGAAIAWATPDAPLVTLTDINRGLWLKHLDVRNGWVFSYAMNNYWFTNYRAGQGGEHTFRYSITSAARLGGAELARFDAETRSPLAPYNYFDTGNVRLHPGPRRMPVAAGAFLKVDAANAQVTAFKPAEDGSGYILRLRETAGQAGTAQVSSPVFPLLRAERLNAVEADRAPLPVRDGAVAVPLEPYRFTTVRLLFGK